MKHMCCLLVVGVLAGVAGANVIDELSINVRSGSTVYSSELTAGQEYLIEVAGYVSANGLANDCIDANAHLFHETAGTYYGRHGTAMLRIDGQSLDLLGSSDGGQTWQAAAYSPDHVYRLYVNGEGAAKGFRVYDSYYGDNRGWHTVTISEVPEPATMLLLAGGAALMTRRK